MFYCCVQEPGGFLSVGGTHARCNRRQHKTWGSGIPLLDLLLATSPTILQPEHDTLASRQQH